MKPTFCVLLELQTDDPRFTNESVASASTAEGAASTRAAVIEHLPGSVTRVANRDRGARPS